MDNSIKVNPNLVRISKGKNCFIYDSRTGNCAKVNKDALIILDTIKEVESIKLVLENCHAKGIENLIDIFKEKGFIYEENKYIDYTNITEKNIKNGELVRNLRLNITESCNLNCSYCYERISNVFKKRRVMSWEVAKKSIDKFLEILINNKTCKCNIRFFGGEPLINWPLIEQCINYIIEKFPPNINVNFMINTNGTLLTNEICYRLAAYKVNVILSLDGVGEQHDVNRTYINGKGSFKDVDKRIDMLAKAGCEISITVVCTDSNYLFLNNLIDYVEDKKIKYNANIHISFNNIHLCSREGIVNMSIEDRTSYLMKAIRYAKTKNINTSGGLTHLVFNNLMHKAKGRHCAGIGYELSIDPDGNVFPCSGVDVKLGNIDNIEEIFKSKNYLKIANRVKGSIPECIGCEIEAYCAGGCYGEYLSVDGKEKNTLRDCELEKQNFIELIKEYVLE